MAFGPKPRDFSTKLPRKIYDLAWRTALSYRYRKGELIIIDEAMNIEFPETSYAKQIFERNNWGNADGRSLLVTELVRENLSLALRDAGEDGRLLAVQDVDVKDLLEMKRVIVEKGALDWMLAEHQSDLVG